MDVCNKQIIEELLQRLSILLWHHSLLISINYYKHKNYNLKEIKKF